MEVKDKIVAVTGAGSGIGLALLKQCLKEGARHVVAIDLHGDRLAEAVNDLGDRVSQFALDVTDPQAIGDMVAKVKDGVGEIDLYFSNAGIFNSDAPDWKATSQSLEQWDTVWKVNVLSHIVALKALLPSMLERGGCGFVITASAAGLLSQIGDTSYSTTKHAALGLAESVAISHGDDGLYVAAICPQAVESRMTAGAMAGESSAALDGIMKAEDMAAFALSEIKAGKFMIRPHSEVETYFQHKAADYERWIGGMRKLRRNQFASNGSPM